MNERSRGQVLPLFALMLIVLLGMAALAIDVSNALQTRRAYRTIADAAALAGGQDLQQAGTRDVNTSDYNNARGHAIESVERELGATATCVRTGDRSDCTFSDLPHEFAVITPIPSGACATCDPERSIQVNFANPAFGLTFARVLGQDTWNVAVTAVAGLQFNKAYTIVTLRPPADDTLPGVRDIKISGTDTRVEVLRGDVGINANMNYDGLNAIMELDSGYKAYYFDPYFVPQWLPDPPTPERIYDLIPDPGYVIPAQTGSTPPGGLEPDAVACETMATDIHDNPNYAPFVPWDAVADLPLMSDIQCYTKGYYDAELRIDNGNLAILEPGLYFFNRGVDAQGSLIGGYTPRSPGVALVFPEGRNLFKNRTSGGGTDPQAVALNAGSRFLSSSGYEAWAASDFSGNPIQTNTDPPTLMTVMVQRDSACRPVWPYPASCSPVVENRNQAIDLAGGSNLYLAGVQFAPADNATLSGNTATGGYVGQVWAWTLTYTGNSLVTQEGSQAAHPGILRLDAACTAPGTPCIP